MKEIEEYLLKLKEQLSSFGINKNEPIINSVKNQMISLLQVWNDIETRNGILLFSKEESLFYMPKCNNNTGAFVVCTIRNSLIESAHSVLYKNFGFEKSLDSEQIKKITSFAISYFKNISFENIALELSKENIDNYYLNVVNKYPLAWDIMKRVANCKKLETRFDKIIISDKKIVHLPLFQTEVEDKKTHVVEDGMSTTFNSVLCHTLDEVTKSNEKIFFTDCFKFVTRNFEKNMKVIQYLLERDSIYVNFNYYISNEYIALRKNFLRPSHDEFELEQKMKCLKDISSKHKHALEIIKNNSISF